MQPLSLNSKIFKHPDKDDITSKLLSGESVKSTESWLRTKYPKRRRMWVSYLTLQAYRKFHLNLQGEVLQEIKNQNKELTLQRIEEKRDLDLKSSDEYKQTKKLVAENLLDMNKEILKVHDKVWERIHILEQQTIKASNDRVITELLSQARTLLVDYSTMLKKQDEMANKGGTNISIQFRQEVDRKVGAMKRAIQKTLQEMAPELIPTFLANLKNEIEVTEQEDSMVPSVNIRVG